jgi:hypothetical protein
MFKLEHTVGCVSVKVIKDSINSTGSRLVTWECTYPRNIHSELLTHGMLRRNSASSRAIPAKKLRERTLANPAMPAIWGANEKGMQSSAEVTDPVVAEDWWRDGLALMTDHHRRGEEMGLHKQIVNRIIEPWMLITIICTATDWANFFHLRKHKAAEPNFQRLAAIMWGLFHESLPEFVAPGDWHLPFVGMAGQTSDLESDLATFSVEDLKKISTGRCARVSYLTHDGKRDPKEDIALHDRLLGAIDDEEARFHASPFEHPCMALDSRERIGPFEGFKQYRKFFPHEAGPNTDDRCFRCGCWNGNHVFSCPNREASR